MNQPNRCELWRWNIDGKLHNRCVRQATVRSEVPGYITRQACAECHQQRLKDARP